MEQLRIHNWRNNNKYSNKLWRLCQDIGKGYKGPKKQRVEGTDNLRIIRYEDIPVDRRNEITYTKVACKYRAHKEDPNQTRITIGVNQICYPGDVGTPAVFLELVKPVINIVLIRRNARFADFDVSNFYLATSMDQP